MRQIERDRAVARNALGPIATALTEAFAEYQRYLAEGVSRDDANVGFALVLQEHWPNAVSPTSPRAQYDCPHCRDTGMAPVHVAESIYGGEQRVRVEPCICPRAKQWHRKGDAQPTESDSQRLARDW